MGQWIDNRDITPEFCQWAFGRDSIELTFQTFGEALERLLELYKEDMEENKKSRRTHKHV